MVAAREVEDSVGGTVWREGARDIPPWRQPTKEDIPVERGATKDNEPANGIPRW